MNTSVQVRSEVATTFENARARIAPLLPKGETLERVIATVELAIANEPKLAACSPQSLFTSVCRILQWGLEIGVTAYLVPFNTKNGPPKATAIADYKGLIELVIKSGCARAVQAFCVFENEHFILHQGTRSEIEHHPSKSSADRGKLLGAYAIIRLPHQESIHEYFPLEDIDEVRRRCSHEWKNGPCPYWWAKKFAFRQTMKLMPKSPRIKHVLSVVVDEEIADLDPDKEIQPPEPPPSAPAAVVRPVVPAAAFEEVDEVRAEVTLPNWRGHPLAGKPLSKVGDTDLGALYSDLKAQADASPDVASKYADLLSHIESEMDDRRQAA